jgi:hypothetical protein
VWVASGRTRSRPFWLARAKSALSAGSFPDPHNPQFWRFGSGERIRSRLAAVSRQSRAAPVSRRCRLAPGGRPAVVRTRPSLAGIGWPSRVHRDRYSVADAGESARTWTRSSAMTGSTTAATTRRSRSADRVALADSYPRRRPRSAHGLENMRPALRVLDPWRPPSLRTRAAATRSWELDRKRSTLAGMFDSQSSLPAPRRPCR